MLIIFLFGYITSVVTRTMSPLDSNVSVDHRRVPDGTVVLVTVEPVDGGKIQGELIL